MNEAVADTGPVLHLEEINRLVALRIFDRLRVPSLVAGELQRYGVVLDNNQVLPSTEIVSVEEERRQAVLSERGVGEIHPADAEVVVVAREARFRFPVLTDDLRLRRKLESEGAVVVGSFGILVRAYRKGLFSAAGLESAVDALFSRSTLHAGEPFRVYARKLLAEALRR